MAQHEQAPPTARTARAAFVATPGTRWESEAHRAALTFQATSGRAVGGPIRPQVQPITDWDDARGRPAPPSVAHTLGGHGTQLSPELRLPFERHFGHDFSRVRVHTGSAAALSARDVDARAYTVGDHIVFGAAQFAPDTHAGRRVLAHELAHVVQQRGATHWQVPPLQRLSFSEALEAGTRVVLGPAAAGVVHAERQFINDLVASVRESPQHVVEFFEEEVLEQILEHLPRIIMVTAGLLIAEEVVAALTAVPEPTLLTKVVAAILQIVILAVLGHFAAVELVGVYEEGRRWLTAARQAHGDPAAIAAASRSFVRMLWHIVMAVLAVAGVRARVRGLARAGPTGGAASGGGGSTAPSAGAAEGSNVVPISRHPGYRPRFESPAGPPSGGPSASAFGPGGTARQLAPEIAPPEPVPIAPAPAPAPIPAVTPTVAAGPTTSGGPGVQVGPAAAAGLSSATNPKKRPPFVLRLPLEKAPHLTTYRRWLGVLQSDPQFQRGNPAQLARWHQAHRGGGSHGIPARVYQRGHTLGLTGDEGERRIRVPDWTRMRSTRMEVDHMVELQLTPAPMRAAFDEVENYELLDSTSNVSSRNRLVASVARERAIQVTFDPTAAGRVLTFDKVEQDGGRVGERWTSEEIRRGVQLNYFR